MGHLGLILLGMLVVVSLWIGIALSRKPRDYTQLRDQLNTLFYQQRLREIDEDDAQGIVTEKAELVTELQHSLLADVPEQQQRTVVVGRRWVMLPIILVVILVTVGMYLKTGGIMQQMELSQVEQDYPQLRERLMDPQAEHLSMAELQQFSLGLRASLQDNPDNVQDWAMLGRLGMVLNNIQLASQSFERALRLAPNDPGLKSDYAEVLVRSPDPQDNRQAQLMLQDMLGRQPQDTRLLTLLAADFYAQQKYPEAIRYWQQLLPHLTPGSAQRDAVEKGIEQAKTNAGLQTSQLSVNIDLSTSAKRMLPQNGVLYISVTDGVSPVPVAVKRVPLSHFPLNLVLDDSNAMVPERLLSAQHQLQVRARISRDGSAKPQHNDWFGLNSVAHFTGKQSLSVIIDQQEP
ncbi:c-type cytochrome biogenesis protein CcmI [Tatumella sp. TA1]|uniref:c-type cytochrome biogenesis protein CcmI n=1 Tax=Rosenbergiella collisarenosi TaxID=1544695 RepID=UPI0008F85A70|nr:c-type cytochrome biogenesis protein CcmI [Rosenbergiella collisarenosi]MBT0720484.1 c-type cytochrome biogenesis protein CcmI [Rosenbergiella collisarenosi]QGX91878.1 c-type cytochrome biogenesis protein CcmI [Tatumella sp. TA1]